MNSKNFSVHRMDVSNVHLAKLDSIQWKHNWLPTWKFQVKSSNRREKHLSETNNFDHWPPLGKRESLLITDDDRDLWRICTRDSVLQTLYYRSCSEQPNGRTLKLLKSSDILRIDWSNYKRVVRTSNTSSPWPDEQMLDGNLIERESCGSHTSICAREWPINCRGFQGDSAVCVCVRLINDPRLGDYFLCPYAQTRPLRPNSQSDSGSSLCCKRLCSKICQ